MERSTKYSTFSGLSGVLAGIASIVGCLVTGAVSHTVPSPDAFRGLFLAIWASVILFAIGADYLLTKRRAAQVGKRILSRLGKQMALASAPGLGTGAFSRSTFAAQPALADLPGLDALLRDRSLRRRSLFSTEVTTLGGAFSRSRDAESAAVSRQRTADDGRHLRRVSYSLRDSNGA